jgi:raffinose/stachyose/melibiose transport system permease protein
MSIRTRERISFVLAVAPAIIAVTVVLWIPISQVVGYSFTDFDGFTGEARFVGLENYLRAFTDPAVGEVLVHTGIYTFFYVVVQLLIAFVLALGVSSGIRGVVAYRAVYFVPVVLSPVAVVFAWSFMFDANSGAINTLLREWGLDALTQNWLGNFDLALYSVITVDLWRSFGYYIVIFVAGLSTLPRETLEAARVDGASALQSLWWVTIPQLRLTFGLALVLALNGAFRAFDTVYLMTRGGPGTSTQLYMTKTFAEAFTNQNFGYGAALSVLLLAVLLAISSLQRRLTSDREDR